MRQKASLVYLALTMIQAIDREEKLLKELHASERKKRRQVSAVIYCIAEKAKTNNLKLYDHFECLLTMIPKHLDDTDHSFIGGAASMIVGFTERCWK